MQEIASKEQLTQALEQNPLIAVYMVFVFGVILLVLIGFGLSWVYILHRRSQGHALLPLQQPWLPRRWGLFDVLGIFFSWIVLQVIGANVARVWLKLTSQEGELSMEIAAIASAASLLSVVLGVAWISGRYQVTPEHSGFTKPSLRLLAIGLITGLACLPLTYILMMLVSGATDTKYEHPLIESASQAGTLKTYLLAVFAAAIAAPIVEEFLFRVVLQGWMQSLPFKSLVANIVGFRPLAALQLSGTTQPPLGSEILSPEPSSSFSTATDAAHQLPTATDIQHASDSPWAVGRADIGGAEETDLRADNLNIDQQIVPPIWPSVVTGILFGLVHFDYGLSFIPLSIFGIVLGIIYRQTHSVWPCILIHMMLNSISMMMVGLVIMMKSAGIELGK
jgi:membrane protease YdiL (CAAX protease family)